MDIRDFIRARTIESIDEAQKYKRMRSAAGIGPDLFFAGEPEMVIITMQAVREIVDLHSNIETAEIWDHGGGDTIKYCSHCGADLDENECPELIVLAKLYSWHPDFDSDWESIEDV